MRCHLTDEIQKFKALSDAELEAFLARAPKNWTVKREAAEWVLRPRIRARCQSKSMEELKALQSGIGEGGIVALWAWCASSELQYRECMRIKNLSDDDLWRELTTINSVNHSSEWERRETNKKGIETKAANAAARHEWLTEIAAVRPPFAAMTAEALLAWRPLPGTTEWEVLAAAEELKQRAKAMEKRARRLRSKSPDYKVRVIPKTAKYKREDLGPLLSGPVPYTREDA